MTRTGTLVWVPVGFVLAAAVLAALLMRTQVVLAPTSPATQQISWPAPVSSMAQSIHADSGSTVVQRTVKLSGTTSLNPAPAAAAPQTAAAPESPAAGTCPAKPGSGLPCTHP